MPQLYYIATCSNSNFNAHTVAFYSDASCTTVATSAVPPTGSMPALEYPCLKISDTSSISAGAMNDATYSIGSVILWRGSATCQGTNNQVRSQFLFFHDAFGVTSCTVAAHFFSAAFINLHCLIAELLSERWRVRSLRHFPPQRVLRRLAQQWPRCILAFFRQPKFPSMQGRCHNRSHGDQWQIQWGGAHAPVAALACSAVIAT